MTHAEQLFAESLQRLKARHSHLTLKLNWEAGIALIASLQLALRHPGNNGRSAQRMRHLLDSIISEIEKDEPTLAKLLRMGDDPRHDTPRTST